MEKNIYAIIKIHPNLYKKFELNRLLPSHCVDLYINHNIPFIYENLNQLTGTQISDLIIKDISFYKKCDLNLLQINNWLTIILKHPQLFKYERWNFNSNINNAYLPTFIHNIPQKELNKCIKHEPALIKKAINN